MDVTTWNPAGKLFKAEYTMEAVQQGAAAISVTTQIPGDPKFGSWPQVKGLTLRVPPIPRWQSTKTLWIFFYTYIPLEFS